MPEAPACTVLANKRYIMSLFAKFALIESLLDLGGGKLLFGKCCFKLQNIQYVFPVIAYYFINTSWHGATMLIPWKQQLSPEKVLNFTFHFCEKM